MENMQYNFFKLEIFVPESHLDIVQKALQEVDAGHIGKYDSCLSYSKVISTWRPLDGTMPYIGEVGKLCRESEYKVEVTCKAEKLDETLYYIKMVHPYEEPVINVIPLLAVGIKKEEEIGVAHQLRFDENMNIFSEPNVRELSPIEREEYDRLTKDASQMTLEDCFKNMGL